MTFCDYGKIIEMKKRNLKKTNTLQVSTLIVLVLALLSLGFYVRDALNKIKDDPDNDPEPQQVYSVSLNDYKVYQFTDIHYDFIMASVTITSNLPFTLGEDPFTTSENIHLQDTSEYSNPLIEEGYTLQCPLPTSETELSKTLCLFIPVINRSTNDLILKVSINRIYNLSFNMNDVVHAGTRSMLGVEEPIVDYTAAIVNRSLISTKAFYLLSEGGDHIEAPFSPDSQVFGFQVAITNNTDIAFTVESAYLSIDGKGTFQTVDSTYLNDDQIKLLGLEIKTTHTGFIFIEVADDSIDLYSFQTSALHLLIKLSNKNSYIEVLFTEPN